MTSLSVQLHEQQENQGKLYARQYAHVRQS